MPVADRVDDEKEKDRERERDQDRADRSKAKASAAKSKDVSHVPCKFFKVGSCTAGSSCPFSHNLAEPGQKDVCAWFVKGNCKFGHKCALAHILPGQPMSMDRKNKKAAQVAAGGAAGNGGQKDSGSKGRKRDSSTQSARNQLLSGSTAPTRPGRSPMSMPLKATISPSAPAPPLKDTDFASLGALDEEVKLPSAPAQGNPTSPPPADLTTTNTEEKPTTSTGATEHSAQAPTSKSPPSPVPLPVNTPRRSNNSHGSPSVDFGPIGSPPRSATNNNTNAPRANGFSPGTSPSAGNNFLSTSPFSAPGSQTVFANPGMRGGVAASLGTGLAMQGRWNNDYGAMQSQVMGRSVSGSGRLAGGEYDINIEYEEQQRRAGRDTAVEDGDFEDFIPSSLTDLLTPEERSRRMSRSNSGQSPNLNGLHTGDGRREGSGVAGGLGNGATSINGSGHRYSRSVPSTSLLGEMANIWSDSNGPSSTAINAALPSSPSRLGDLGNGTPSSFKSHLQSNFGGRADELVGPHSPSPSLLSPTNASAAFLPGIHQHYLNAKAKQANTNIGLGPALGRGMRNASNPLYSSTHTGNMLGPGGNNPVSASIGNYLQTSPTNLSSSPSQVHTFARPTPYDPNSTASDAYLRGGVRPIPTLNPNNPNGVDGDPHILSPNTRALQAHAPGQSLPQGLAAGYSRIHALPPLPLASPGTGVSPGSLSNVASNGSTEWATLDGSSSNSKANPYASPGLEIMMSHSSYSAVASRAVINNSPGAPPGLGRNVSGGKNAASSPLRGVLRKDDDDLFDMEG